jgi:hypothetical protein
MGKYQHMKQNTAINYTGQLKIKLGNERTVGEPFGNTYRVPR